MEHFIIILLFLIALLIIISRTKRFLRELYQTDYKNSRQACKEKPKLKKFYKA